MAPVLCKALPISKPSILKEVLMLYSMLHGIVQEKLLTTHMEEERKKEHLEEVMQRQVLAEEQITKLEHELAEEQKKKEELVILIEGLRTKVANPQSSKFSQPL